MRVKDFEFKKIEGSVIFDKKFFGFGFLIDFHSLTTYRDKIFIIRIDFIFIRFWLNYYK